MVEKTMKLIIQIPCFNEEHTLPGVFRDLPAAIEGIDVIETLVIDDGSTDRTVEIARSLGATHILSNYPNRGLARTFRSGLDEAVRLGADIIVNTDGDNQYAGADIALLVKPILARKAHCVVGVRDIEGIRHFSARKKILQRFGSWVVRKLSGTDVSDVTSGFRAFSREAALSLDLVTDYTHTIETIIALGKEGESIAEVPIRTNGKLRESRLFGSIPDYIKRCVADMLRIYVRYEALKTFAGLGAFTFLIGLLNGGYYLYSRLAHSGRSNVALSLFILFVIAGLLFILLGFLGDSIACNRRMLARISRRQRDLMARLDETDRRA